MKKRIPAKVNLSLSITGKRGELHTLDMEVVSVSLYDEVTAERAAKGISFDFADCYDGFDRERFLPTLRRAVDCFINTFGDVGAKFTVTKNIPLGAGLGGSSTIIAAVVQLLAEIKNVRLDSRFLLSLGSDVPYFAQGGHCQITGVGERVDSLEPIRLHFVALIPSGGVDSAQAYALYDAFGAMPFGRRINDLEFAARKLNPDVVTAREILTSAGAQDVVMSGSGSAVVAVFENKSRAEEIFDAVKCPKGFGKKLLYSV